MEDRQQEWPVYHCAACDGEIYAGNTFFRVDGKVYCESCVEEEVAEWE